MKTHPLLLALLFSLFFGNLVTADDWPQWRGPGRDGVWRESGVIEKFDRPQIPLRWRAEIAGGNRASQLHDRGIEGIRRRGPDHSVYPAFRRLVGLAGRRNLERHDRLIRRQGTAGDASPPMT